MKRINQVGDTIVEVLIAIAIMSSILTAAYAIANRSLTDIRQAQEHTEALKYAEKQTERLKLLADGGGTDNAGGNIFLTPISPFCVIPNMGGFKIASGPANCNFGTAPVTYTVGITRTPVPGSSYSFTYSIVITWPGIHGGTDKVSLSYRLDS